jgi:hypothetical protein
MILPPANSETPIHKLAKDAFIYTSGTDTNHAKEVLE